MSKSHYSSDKKIVNATRGRGRCDTSKIYKRVSVRVTNQYCTHLLPDGLLDSWKKKFKMGTMDLHTIRVRHVHSGSKLFNFATRSHLTRS